jgi:hypothetical protein
MDQLVPGLVVVAFVGLAVLSVFFRFSRSRSLLDGWARSQGFRIVSREKCLFFKGPFFLTTAKGQDVYYVTVKDAQGQTRRGYVRVGGLFFGMLSENVEVRWES